MPNKHAQFDDPFKKIKSGGWTKHGGARFGLIHSQAEQVWHCQGCGDEQPNELPGFFLEVLPSEYVKVCGRCFSFARKNGYSYQRVVVHMRVENR